MRHGGLAVGLAGLGAAAGLIALGMVLAPRSEDAVWAAAPPASSEGVLLSATPLGGDRALVCLVDTGRQRLLVYLADGGRNRLRLLAVRDISADWNLTDYNNDRPYPKDIRQSVEKWRGAVEGEAPKSPVP